MKKNHRKKITALLVILLQAPACSQSFIQEEWQCPLMQGEGCLSIEEADDLAEDTAPVPPPGGGGELFPAPAQGETALRTKEKLARIWVAPFVDENDIFHEGGYIHVLIEAASWRGQQGLNEVSQP